MENNDHITRKDLKVLAIILLICLLIPVPMAYKDGGSVAYTAALYKVVKVHQLAPGSAQTEDGFIRGTIIKILGVEIYNDAWCGDEKVDGF